MLRTEFGEDLMKIVARFRSNLTHRNTRFAHTHSQPLCRPDAVPAKPVAEETVDETPVPAPSDEEGPVAAPTADSQEAKSSKKKRHKHKHKHKHRRRKKSEKGAGVEPQQDDKGLHELLTAVAKDLFEEYDAVCACRMAMRNSLVQWLTQTLISEQGQSVAADGAA